MVKVVVPIVPSRSVRAVINPVPATMRKAVREVTASSVLAITTVPEMAIRRTTTSIVAVTASRVLAGNLVPATIPMRNTA